MPSVKKSYKKSDAEYAKDYNISSSSVFRYKKELAPLDNPRAFAAWIAQRPHKPKSMRLPGGLREHRVTHVRRKVESESARSEADEKSPPPARERRHLIEGAGLRVEIKRQEAECENAYKLYRQAVDAEDHLASHSYHKIWVAAQKSLRELCKDVPKSEQDDAKVLPVGDVEAAWSAALNEINTQVSNIGATVSLGLIGVDQETRLQVEKAINAEAAEVISNLRLTPWIK